MLRKADVLRLCPILLAAIAQIVSVNAKSASVASYFRLVVNLEYDSKPFPIDIVVGCNVKVTHYSFGGSSRDTMGVSAVTFVQATPDGHAIGVRSLPPYGLNLCGGDTTSNGRVPQTYMPLIAWFERADELGQGIGYRTPAAYTNPNSRLRFHGARVQEATREEFDDFQANGVKNLLPPYQVDWLTQPLPPIERNGVIPQQYIENPKSAWRYGGARQCHGVARIRLTRSQRDEVRKYWPSERPRYWQPTNREDWERLRKTIPTADQRVPSEKFAITDSLNESYDVFPATISYSIGRLNRNTFSDGLYYYDIDIGDGLQNKGFMSCYSFASTKLEAAVTSREVVISNRLQRLACRVDLSMPPHVGDGCDQLPQYMILEKDEYVIVPLQGLSF